VPLFTYQGTAQCSAAQRSAAQHSTAQHSTAQHSTAQRLDASFALPTCGANGRAEYERFCDHDFRTQIGTFEAFRPHISV
jgi:hypothetical protein